MLILLADQSLCELYVKQLLHIIKYTIILCW